MRSDQIEREITIHAPIETVWKVLTEPAAVSTWFGTGRPVQIDLRPGGVMTLDHGVHGAYATVIVTVDPPRTFSYRWASAYPGELATEDNSTLVELTLEPLADATLLRVVETGFDALVIPPERAESAGYDSHVQGWTGVLAKARDYAEGADRSPLLAQA